jgi:hypothetical protein
MMLAPWLAWLAAVTSLVLLAFRTIDEDESPRWRLAVLWIWFAAAAYLQFGGDTAVLNAAGLSGLTLLAILLLIWRRSRA